MAVHLTMRNFLIFSYKPQNIQALGKMISKIHGNIQKNVQHTLTDPLITYEKPFS